MDYEFTLNLKILDTFLSQSQYTIKSQIGKTKHTQIEEQKRKSKTMLIELSCVQFTNKKNLHRSKFEMKTY